MSAAREEKGKKSHSYTQETDLCKRRDEKIENIRLLKGKDELAAKSYKMRAASIANKCTITLHMDEHPSDGSFLFYKIR